MFFDDDIANTALGEAWRAAHIENAEASRDLPLPVICQQLKPLINNNHNNPKRRLALRTSAILIDGATRIYKQQMQQLFTDVVGLNMDTITRKRKCSSDLDDSSKDSSESGSFSSPDLIRRIPQASADIQDTSMVLSIDRKRKRSSIQPPQFSHYSLSSSSEKNSPFKKKLTEERRKSFSMEQSEQLSDNQSQITEGEEENRTSKEETNESAYNQTASNETEDTDPNLSSEERGTESYKESEADNTRQSFSPNLTELINNNSKRKSDSDKPDKELEEINKRIISKTGASDLGKPDNDYRDKIIEKANVVKPKSTTTNESTPNSNNLSEIPLDKNFDASTKEGSRGMRSPLVEENLPVDFPSTESDNSVILQRPAISRTRKRKSPNQRVVLSEEPTTSNRETRDQATQSEPFSINITTEHAVLGVRQNIKGPFGYLFIYDSCNSSIPSKVVVSALNPRVRNLIPN